MILHQIDKVFIIPVVQSSFSYLQFFLLFNSVLCAANLEMRRCNTTSKLCEKRAHDFCKLFVLNNVQDLLQLVEEHHFFRRVRFWPEFEQPIDHLNRVSTVLKLTVLQ